jgi:hypothetical protein
MYSLLIFNTKHFKGVFMNHLLTRSLFLAVAAQCFIIVCAEPQPLFPYARGGARYNRAHIATTALSYAGAFVLTPAIQFMGVFMMEDSPWKALAMIYGAPLVGAGLVGATPYWTNQVLYKQGCLSKKDATYTPKQLFVHSAARILVFGLLYLYGNATINATKILLFNIRN